MSNLVEIAEKQFGDMVKAVVDVRRGIIALGSEMHSDDEAALLDDGSRQEDLWGINIYPQQTGTERIEYDSMINIRPSGGNRSRGVDDPVLRDVIRRVVDGLLTP